MISLPLVNGGNVYLNPDYIFSMEELTNLTCRVHVDAPGGVEVFDIALSAGRVVNRLNRND